MAATLKREGEPFTASVDCPECGRIDVHWLDEPRFRPENPTALQVAQQSIHSMAEFTSSFCLVNFQGETVREDRKSVPRLYDPAGTVIARICTSCGHRWGQS
ncbi:hypothetical protein [Mycolicibacterium fortuitum]|uniref:hypothetical protein n=1 Tax=Mycolicibacterium fortuitum TaxID=1766 RepID=UPI003AB00961